MSTAGAIAREAHQLAPLAGYVVAVVGLDQLGRRVNVWRWQLESWLWGRHAAAAAVATGTVEAAQDGTDDGRSEARTSPDPTAAPTAGPRDPAPDPGACLAVGGRS